MFNIPHVMRVPFKRHFIDRAVCELRFASVEGVDWDSAEVQFKKVASAVGLTTVKKSIESMFQLQTASDEGKAKELNIDSRIIGLIGTPSDGKQNLEIRADRIIITSQQYRGFKDFWNFVTKALPAFQSIWGIKEFSWIGIRKTNMIGIVLPGGDYEGQGVNSLVYAPIRKGILDGKKIRLAEARYTLSDNATTCNIKTQSVRDSDLTKVNLVIDLDVNRNIDKFVELKELSKIAEELNEVLYDVFCWVTDPELIEQMRQD